MFQLLVVNHFQGRRQRVRTRLEFPTHWTDVRDELPTVIYGVKESKPQQSPDDILEQDFLLTDDHPGLMVAGDVV